MPKTKISEWSSTPANNTDIDSINIAEGCAPSGINDAIRELMAQVKDLYAGTSGDLIAVAGGGTGVGTLTGIVKGNGTSAFTAVTAPTGAIVGTTDTQTLTNKTLTAPTIASANITTALTLTGAAGTSGQVLTSGGSGAAPTWTTASGASAATPTALGTVYGKTDSASPFNTFGGYQAGNAITSATSNTAVGYQALRDNTSGGGNAAFGKFALIQNTTAANNAAFGQGAMFGNLTGANNTGVGTDALANTTASDNVGVGYQALYSNTTSLNNVGIGYQALYSMTTTGVGNNNVGIGKNAGYSNTAGSSVFIGYAAGYYCTAANNIFIGLNAGATNSVNVTTGTNNVVIGNAVSLAAATNTNSLVLGDNVNGKGSSTGFISSGGGGVYQGNNSSSWSTTSDQRLKKNIADNNDGLDKINSIRVRNFEYRLPEEVDAELKPTDAIKKTGTQLGVIAQELQAVLPECVKQESTGVLSVDTDNLTWYMINAIKELKAEIDQLKGNV